LRWDYTPEQMERDALNACDVMNKVVD